MALAIGLWLAVGVILFWDLGGLPIHRSQEARVLETARQMLGAPAHDWLIPKLNGDVRLRKPPLVYWMTAASYMIFGVHEWAGRLPTFLCSWLTIGVLYLIVRRLFDEKAGLLAGLVLASMHLFIRHARMAETDPAATLFVTLAIYGLLRGLDWPNPAPLPSSLVKRFGWYHLAAAATALTLLSKGPQAAFVAVFLLLIVLVFKRWWILRELLFSGAPLTFFYLAIPWFLYILTDPAAGQITDEIAIAATGANHFRPFYSYLYWLMLACIPWTGFIVAGVATGIRRCRSNPALQAILFWSGAVFIPLCLTGNKQLHYLLPLLPPIAALTGWLLERALSGDDPGLTNLVRTLFAGTVLCGLIAALALPGVGYWEAGEIRIVDQVMSIVMVTVAGLAAWWWKRSPDKGLVVMALGCAIVQVGIFNYWMSVLRNDRTRDLAQRVQQALGDRSYILYGQNQSLSLCFDLRKAIPATNDERDLARLLAETPDAVIININKPRRAAPVPPAPFTPAYSETLDETIFTFYERKKPASFLPARSIPPNESQ